MPKTPFIYSDDLTGYDFGLQHPLRPERLPLTHELASGYGLFEDRSLLLPPKPATDSDILTFHTPEYVSVVRRLSRGEHLRDASQYGFGFGDNPPFVGMYEASLLYTGASLVAAESVATRAVPCAFSISGGLHHAMADRASGFCIFNDPVIAIHRLRRTVARVAYIDVDAHHGDGVQAAFYDRRDVLTISIHESGQYLFPGTGFVQEIGEGDGRGFSANIPLLPGTPEEVHVWAFGEVVPPLISAFDPGVIVAQLGADTHFEDPLAHLRLTSKGFIELLRTILSFGKPVVALGGGGYNVRSVARLWTLAYAQMLGVDLPDAVPEDFAGDHGITHLRDPEPPPPSEESVEGRSATEAAHRTVNDLRRLLFPLHGLKV